MADLPIQPDYSSSLTKKPRVRKVSMGDGYEQRAGDGLNTNPDRWSLSWDELTDSEIATLLSFFDGLAAVTSFSWQSIYSTTAKKYICDQWEPTPVSDNRHRLTASIYQVFEP